MRLYSIQRWVVAFAGCLLVLAGAQAAPLERADAIRVLGRAATAAEMVSYTGNYVYQYGESVANYQIIHLFDDGVSIERRVLLDGKPKEYIRNGEKVSMYPPQEQGFVLDRRYTSKLFPNQLPHDLEGLLQSYRLTKIGRDRVAGRDAIIYQLDPVDAYRYPQRLWIDVESGLILKSLMMGMRQEMVQQFSFAQVQVGGKIDRELLKPTNPVREVAVVDAEMIDITKNPQFVIKPAVPGFKLIKQNTRNLPYKNREVTHHLYSDGAVTLSVFIEPKNLKMPLGLAHQGPVHLYSRQLGNHLVSCLGEVPAATVESFANAYSLR
ncbi:MucB/RseB C-terminal domain-containing protein [Deefgea tanakiae]|uniref:MucB/RseB C-terminal domain-containing protein n=1 Tax=Deefgea tanakiae TaxID=2865840 RepID=A0ABX8Z8S3_9NEIS|nr:MucB/RseB C-terminal domain-containing protein [Deefgea tanakiae]QZA78820.1 MucB/RseB C-terminal domain-containing protein [Deefgea tanakiae]